MSDHPSPGEAVRALVGARGPDWVVDRCVEAATGEAVDADFVVGVAGAHGRLVLSGREGGVEGYWPRVWALRALLYTWSERAAPAVVAALRDESWRAREMALKVAVRRGVAIPAAARRRALADPVERVRAAARRLGRARCDDATVTTSLYDAMGGEDVILALCASLHERCLADPVLNHPFSHAGVRPDHVERLAAYLTQVTGGPARYSALGVDHSDMLALHAGEGDTTELGARFLECFLAAADDVGVGADAPLRAALAAAMARAVAEVVAYPDSPDDVPRGLAPLTGRADGTLSPG